MVASACMALDIQRWERPVQACMRAVPWGLVARPWTAGAPPTQSVVPPLWLLLLPLPSIAGTRAGARLHVRLPSSLCCWRPGVSSLHHSSFSYAGTAPGATLEMAAKPLNQQAAWKQPSLSITSANSIFSDRKRLLLEVHLCDDTPGCHPTPKGSPEGFRECSVFCKSLWGRLLAQNTCARAPKGKGKPLQWLLCHCNVLGCPLPGAPNFSLPNGFAIKAPACFAGA